MSHADSSSLTLEIIAGGAKRVIPLSDPVYRIGRQNDNTIVIDDQLASRRHCVLERSDSGYVLRDLESHNGTWIGKTRIREVKLSDGDCFRVGETLFLLTIPQTAAAPDVEDIAPEAPVEPPTPAAPSRPAPTPRAPIQRPARVVQPAVRKAATPVRQDLTDAGSDIIDIPTPEGAPVAASAPKSDWGSGMLGTSAGMESGPVTRQLQPLLKVAELTAAAKRLPVTYRGVTLLDRQSRPVKIDPADTSRPTEAIAALQQILLAGLRTRVTDIHLEPKETVFGLRVRIDGVLHQLGEIGRPMGLAFLNVIKVLCQVDFAKKNVVQEGSFGIALPDRRVDVRVSMTPIPMGQKLALRLLDKTSVPSRFEDLGMEADLATEIRRMLGQDAGMIVVSGPTGSGKSTTLYTALNCIDARRRNVVTIEDPIEYRMEHTTQIAIDPIHNVTYASVMASVLRQDPDVIFVGEIRDKETAEMAMQAASTGHLVLTTVHARDTIGTVFRLLDLGVEPFQIANAVSLAISQRLVRVLCPHCKRRFRPDARLCRQLRLDEHQQFELCDGVGCSRCMQTGYLGRVAVCEVLKFTPALRDVIITQPTIADIRKAAGDWLFRTLHDSSRRKVLQGITSIEEMERVSSSD